MHLRSQRKLHASLSNFLVFLNVDGCLEERIVKVRNRIIFREALAYITY
jgi:hypothetical protein